MIEHKPGAHFARHLSLCWAAGWYVNVFIGHAWQSLKPDVGGSAENEFLGHSIHGSKPWWNKKVIGNYWTVIVNRRIQFCLQNFFDENKRNWFL